MLVAKNATTQTSPHCVSEHIPGGLVLSVGGLTLVIDVSLCAVGIRVVCGNGALSKIIVPTAGLLGSLVSSFSLLL